MKLIITDQIVVIERSVPEQMLRVGTVYLQTSDNWLNFLVSLFHPSIFPIIYSLLLLLRLLQSLQCKHLAKLQRWTRNLERTMRCREESESVREFMGWKQQGSLSSFFSFIRLSSLFLSSHSSSLIPILLLLSILLHPPPPPQLPNCSCCWHYLFHSSSWCLQLSFILTTFFPNTFLMFKYHLSIHMFHKCPKND